MTLIEILVALTLGAFLLAGTIQIFLSTKQSYRMQEGQSRLQENGRFAMEFLTKDIRMAGFWGCTDIADIESKLNTPNSVFDDYAIGVTGTNDNNVGNDHDADNDENGDSIWDGTDTITLRGAWGAGIQIDSQPVNTNAEIKVVKNSGLQQNEIVVISNCTSGDIFQITDVNISGTFDNIIHNTGALSSCDSLLPWCVGNFEADLEVGPRPASSPIDDVYKAPEAQILRIGFVTYQIRNGDGNQPALFRSVNGSAFQELVEGIEDMQILYGPDPDADGTPNYYVPSSSLTTALMNQVVSVRISLLLRSIEDNLVSDPMTYTINDVMTTATDKRLYRVYTSTVAVRNRLP